MGPGLGRGSTRVVGWKSKGRGWRARAALAGGIALVLVMAFSLVVAPVGGVLAQGESWVAHRLPAGTGAVNDLVLFNGQIYAATDEDGGSQGVVYRSNDGSTWERVAVDDQHEVYQIASLAVFGGMIYAGTYDASNGRIYRSGNGSSWEVVWQKPNGGNPVQALHVFEGKLYAGTCKGKWGRIFRSPDGERWTSVTPLGLEIGPVFDFVTHYNPGGRLKLWAATYDHPAQRAAIVHSPNGRYWIKSRANEVKRSGILTLAAFDGKLYGGTQLEDADRSGGAGYVWRWEDGAGRQLGNGHAAVQSLLPHGDLLYAAAYSPDMDSLAVYTSEDGDAWSGGTSLGNGHFYPAALAELDGKLYLGTRDSSGGVVYELQ